MLALRENTIFFETCQAADMDDSYPAHRKLDYPTKKGYNMPSPLDTGADLHISSFSND
jgi:hypothetical protein